MQKIRGGIDAGRRASWWRNPASLSPPLVGGRRSPASRVGGGTIFGLGNNDDAGSTRRRRRPTRPTASASETASTSPSSTPSPSETASGPVYVYYIHDDGQSPRLYRESHPGVGTGPEPAVALRAMFAGQPDDPDYASPWDNTKLLSYRVDARHGHRRPVELRSLGAAVEQAAVQEIVYTVTANDPAVKRVRLLVHGKAPARSHRLVAARSRARRWSTCKD